MIICALAELPIPKRGAFFAHNTTREMGWKVE